MASQAVDAADHTSAATDQQIEKKNEEGTGEKTVSLINENEHKLDEARDEAPPLSKTEEEGAEREEKAANDEGSLQESVADNLKETNEEHPTQSQPTTITEPAIDSAAEHIVHKEIEKEKQVKEEDIPKVSDDVKQDEHKPLPDSDLISVKQPEADPAASNVSQPTEATERETPQKPEIEEEGQIKGVAADTIEKSSDHTEVSYPKEPKSDEVKENDNSEISSVTPALKKSEEAEKEEEKKEMEQQTTVSIPESSFETMEKTSDATEEKTREVENSNGEVVKEISNPEEGPTEPEKPEPVVTEVEEISKPEAGPPEPEKPQSVVTEVEETSKPEAGSTEPEKPEPVVTEVEEISKPEAGPPEPEKPQSVVTEVEETSKPEAGPTELEKPEPVVIEVVDNPSEPEKQSLEKEQEDQSQRIIHDSVEKEDTVKVETVETEKPELRSLQVEEKLKELSDVEKKGKDMETEQELISDAVEERPREEDKSKDVVTEKELTNVSAATREASEDTVKEQKVEKEEETNVTSTTAQVTPKEEAEEASANVVEPSPVITEKVAEEEKCVEEKEISVTTNIASVVSKEEAEVAFADVVESSAATAERVVTVEKVEDEGIKINVAENTVELIWLSLRRCGGINVAENTVEDVSKREPEAASANGVESSAVTVEKVVEEEKIDKEEGINVKGVTEQVTSKEEAEAASEANGVESSPINAEKVVEEEGKKDGVEEVSKEVVGVSENPLHISVNQETKIDRTEEKQSSVATCVEEKKELKASDTVEKLSGEAEVEINKVVKQTNEAKETTTEVEEDGVKMADTIKDNQTGADKAENKEDDGSTVVSESVRETLASKFEEEESGAKKGQVDEPVETEAGAPITEAATKESDATKTAKDLPKETIIKSQKHSNNIISKVKQSLVKAKKALTGKSPSSKNLTADTKGDIKVK